MDTQRLILILIFCFSTFMLIQAWQRESRGPGSPPVEGEVAKSKSSTDATPKPTVKLELPTAPGSLTPTQGKAKVSDLVHVTTDVLAVDIDTVGATIVRAELLRHRATEDTTKNFVLLGPKHSYSAQSGLIGEGLPNHHSRFEAAAQKYTLRDGENRLEVRLEAHGSGGIVVRKTLIFERSSYLVTIRQEIQNSNSRVVEPYGYYQLVRDDKPPEGTSRMVPSFTGAAIYDHKDKYKKVSFEDIAKGKTPYSKSAEDGWIGIVQHYFLGAWVVPQKVMREFFTKRLADNLYAVGLIIPFNKVEPGASVTQSVELYLGPQDQNKLRSIAEGLDLTVDYGWLTVIAVPIFWVLKTIHAGVGNWGVAIILLTVLIKSLFYPLSAASYRSMAKMRVLAPKLQRLKEQYGSDRQRMQQAMMELYKTEKINPLGGCLPIVVQIPVFISLYWVLLASFELRHAPFIFWIHDLAAKDPYYILPILMGASMIIQSRLNPEPPDPVQAKVMKIMPIAFSIFFFFFPAGLVLYWLVNNILSIAQQWHITRGLERAGIAHGKR